MHGTFGEGIVYFFCVVASVSGVCLGVGVGTFFIIMMCHSIFFRFSGGWGRYMADYFSREGFFPFYI